MQTTVYRQQHGEILRSLDHVNRMMESASEQDICLELSRLAGVVKMHLTLEDKNLYPRMLEHSDPAVRETAAEYQRTMGNLAPAYLSFHEKWMRSGAIEQERVQFIKEFGNVRDALKQRIALENSGLYDLVDKQNIRLAS